MSGPVTFPVAATQNFFFVCQNRHPDLLKKSNLLTIEWPAAEAQNAEFPSVNGIHAQELTLTR